MRITGGRYCGRVIKVERGGLEIRPAMDRMRESIFAVLGDLSGKSFLDLFTGSGIIALEAASRGAINVECVEKDMSKRHNLIENLSISEDRIACHIMPVELFIKRCKTRFDLVFLDPPFPYRFRAQLLKSISDRACVTEGGRVLMHYPGEDKLPEKIGNLALVDHREYGRSRIAIFEYGQLETEN